MVVASDFNEMAPTHPQCATADTGKHPRRAITHAPPKQPHCATAGIGKHPRRATTKHPRCIPPLMSSDTRHHQAAPFKIICELDIKILYVELRMVAKFFFEKMFFRIKNI